MSSEPRQGQGCALVTGASRGIGAAIARAIATDGWSVGVNYRSDAEGARTVVEEIAAGGGQAFEIEADVADESSVKSMFDTVEERFGPVVVLVNNAGIRNDRLLQGLSREDWGRIVDVNLHGAFHTIQRALAPMIKNHFGRIINVSSISASRPQPAQAAYAASKAGVEALTRTVAQEVTRRGVTVNAIAPGLIDTDFIPDELRSEEAARVLPARRLGRPEEVAAVARFLVSEEAGYISGTVITMDGGFTAGLGTGGQYWRPKSHSGSDA
jgi:3-oxoacyl-[acyl-carrier protein] reductase